MMMMMSIHTRARTFSLSFKHTHTHIYILAQIHAPWTSLFGGAGGVMFIVGNGHGDTSSNPGQD